MSPRNSSTATCSPTAVDTGVKKRKASGEGDDDTNREPCKMHKPNPRRTIPTSTKTTTTRRGTLTIDLCSVTGVGLSVVSSDTAQPHRNKGLMIKDIGRAHWVV
ncbi:hypothetical protein BZA77DRAFT_298014 [Pyronema omphalodes]|nr:hypothetical protein BZA77DRAFT_298014 [Pyronema omphalodes]